MSERRTYFLSSFITPNATPATAFFRGIPASKQESDAPHTLAIEEEPLDSSISDTNLMV